MELHVHVQARMTDGRAMGVGVKSGYCIGKKLETFLAEKTGETCSPDHSARATHMRRAVTLT
jgi:hypothetical protein